MLRTFFQRPIRSGLLFIAAMFAAGCTSGGGKGITYEKNYKGTYETGTTLLASTVNFTLSWNESNGVVTGTYQDDHFAKSGVSLSGTVANGAYSFTVVLKDVIEGVQSIEIGVASVGGVLEADIQGKDSSGATVFAAMNVALESFGNGGSGTSKPADVASFFSQVAGTYKWIAKRTGKADTTFTKGKEYSITITADKKVSVPKDDGTTFTFTYGEDAGDTFEAYDHEAYIIVTRDGVKVLVQHHFEGDKVSLSYEIGAGTDGSFWTFSDASENTSAGNMESLGTGDAVGEFTAIITSRSGSASDYRFDVGQELTFAIDEDGNVTGDFGTFEYDDTTFHHATVIQSGVEVHQMYWYSPSKTATVKDSFQVHLKEGTFSSITFTVDNNGVGTYHYAKLK